MNRKLHIFSSRVLSWEAFLGSIVFYCWESNIKIINIKSLREESSTKPHLIAGDSFILYDTNFPIEYMKYVKTLQSKSI